MDPDVARPSAVALELLGPGLRVHREQPDVGEVAEVRDRDAHVLGVVRRVLRDHEPRRAGVARAREQARRPGLVAERGDDVHPLRPRIRDSQIDPGLVRCVRPASRMIVDLHHELRAAEDRHVAEFLVQRRLHRRRCMAAAAEGQQQAGGHAAHDHRSDPP